MISQEELVQKLKEICPGGKISCSEARELAAKLAVDPKEIGAACNAAAIKIFACELACF